MVRLTIAFAGLNADCHSPTFPSARPSPLVPWHVSDPLRRFSAAIAVNRLILTNRLSPVKFFSRLALDPDRDESSCQAASTLGIPMSSR